MTNLRNLIPSTALLLAQIPTAWAVGVSTVCARSVWAEVLEGAVLPHSTNIAMRFGMGIPIAAAIASVLFFVLAWRGERPYSGCLFGVATCEALLLALNGLGLVLPALTITWHIGS